MVPRKGVRIMGFIVTLMFFVGGGLLLGARSRIGRLEHRLLLVEGELRLWIAAGGVPLSRQKAADAQTVPTAPMEVPQPVAEPHRTPDPEPKPEAVPEFEPVIAQPAPLADVGPQVEEEQQAEEAPLAVELPVAQEQPPLLTAARRIPASRIARPQLEAPAHADVETEVDEPEPVSKPIAASAPRAPRATINFEELFGRKLPIWAGGITLAIAGVLIVKYAIDAGLFGRVFTPGVQAVCGLLFGLGLIGGAEWAHLRRDKVDDPRVSQALSGAGISTLYASLLVAANLYHLISPLTAFIGLALVTAVALWLSLRHGMPSALLGLAGGLAAPALTVGLDANVPMLATYLGFTIAGLVGVSRMQRWPWLAAFALLGGAGWSLWLILAGQALTMIGALSVGGFVLMLAIAAPLFAFRDAGATLLRVVSAIIGAAQLALLVATGGYQPLYWGLFALIAFAGQFLAWREKEFAIVPTLGAALSFLLLMLWPHPTGGWLATFALVLAAIHALPLLVRLWHMPVLKQRAVELCAIAVAAPIVALWHFHAPWGETDVLAALAAAGGGLLTLAGAVSGWKADRQDDSRFALLLATTGGLLSAAAWFAMPHWQAPLWIAAIASALLLVSRPAADWRIEPLAAFYAALALFMLVLTTISRSGEASVLIGVHSGEIDSASLLRWSGMAAMFALFAWRAEQTVLRLHAWMLVTCLTYGVLAQLVPQWSLPLAMVVVTAATLIAMQKRDEEPAAESQLLLFAAASVVLLGITGPHPLGEWLRLIDTGDAPASAQALLRWGGVTVLGVFFAWRSRLPAMRLLGQFVAIPLAYGALAQVVPGWSLPLAMAAVTAAGLIALQKRGELPNAEGQLLLFAAASVCLLGITGPNPLGEWLRLADMGDAPVNILAMLRWGGVAMLGAFFAWRSRLPWLRSLAQFAAMLLAYGALAQIVPGWTLPVAMAAVAGAGFLVLHRQGSALSDRQVLTLAAGGLYLLATTGGDPMAEWQRLAGLGNGSLDGAALARWAAVAALGMLLAARSREWLVRELGQAMAVLLGYGALAQIVPLVALPLVAPAACLCLAWWSRSLEWPRLRTGVALLAVIAAAWAFLPLLWWWIEAVRSLGGIPMLLEAPLLQPLSIARRLFVPALLLGGSLWLLRERLARMALFPLAGLIGLLGMVAVHSLYRAGFSEAFGSDFIATGLGQRLLWSALLAGTGYTLWKRAGGMLASHAAPALIMVAGLHVAWYSLVLYDPLWTAQAVGSLPLLNLLFPLFAALPLCLMLMARMSPKWAETIDRVLQPLLMVMVAVLAWASLRQLFHGSLLTDPGVSQLEDILRSITGIALAIGYLLWGIRKNRHNWRIASLVLMLAAVAKVFLLDANGLEGLLRIASFVALGFSLIGIGWLYSRQLRHSES